MLEARNLTRDFGTHRALDSLNLRIDRGEIFCLLGANGAGKTTTIRLFLGFLQPTEGEAVVDGIVVANDPLAAKRRLLYIPEQISLYGELSGYENLEYFAGLAGVEQLNREMLVPCLIEAGLPKEAIDRRSKGYSKGMRQKVGIALAIAKSADALLLDEPTSGLDPKASVEFHSLILKERQRGSAVLMATHDIFRAREVADRIGVMREGKLRRIIQAKEVTSTDLEAIYLEEMS